MLGTWGGSSLPKSWLNKRILWYGIVLGCFEALWVVYIGTKVLQILTGQISIIVNGKNKKIVIL